MASKTGNGAVIIAGTQSGCGKTTVTLGLMAALKARGSAVTPFKCGPDFIDPSLHRLVTGRVSRNLDLWMCGEEFVENLFARHRPDGDIAIIEGVMGMFDGGTSSSAALATALNVPVVLVLDVRSAAESVAAVLKGFEMLEPAAAPRGVILNRVGSPRHLQLVADAIKKHCRAEILGYLPRDVEFSIPGRHLGLKMGEEAPLSQEAVSRLADTVAAHIDLDRLLELAAEAQAPCGAAMGQESASHRVRIGVARDRAFCFYYEENFDLLRRAGAELIFFSPLEDRGLPEEIDGIYLGGGYPELFANELARNQGMLAAIREWAEAGRPIYAECGGFMYLTKEIRSIEGQTLPMVGVFPVTARMQERRASLGYREIRLARNCILGSAGAVLRGHEFHYSSIGEMPATIERLYEVNNGEQEGYRHKNVLGGYMHLHFGSAPDAAASFVAMCAQGE